MRTLKGVIVRTIAPQYDMPASELLAKEFKHQKFSTDTPN
jgi:hypothetical protein